MQIKRSFSPTASFTAPDKIVTTTDPDFGGTTTLVKRILFSLLFFIAFANASAQKAEHVVLITIDGFRPDFYLEQGWNTPNLRAMMRAGFHAKGVNSVFPSMTYPSHTTIVTGVRPAKHGIYFNSMFEPNGPTGKIYWMDSSIKVPTLWTAAKDKGLKTAAMFWPVSADAPVDYNIADVGSMGVKNMAAYAKPAGFYDLVRKELFNDSPRIDLGKDYNVANIAAKVIKEGKPNFMTIHFFGVDSKSHQQGRNGEAVKEAVAVADSSVGIVMQALKDAGIFEKTVFIVTGDHGFTDVTSTVSPNVWLKEAGIIKDVKTDDWKAQFFSVGGSSYLYLKDKNDQQTAKQVLDLLNKLPSEHKKLFRIIDRKKMDGAGANPDVAFAITAENGGSFGNSMTGEAVKARTLGGAHGNFPDFKEIRTGFVAIGPGVKAGTSVQLMELRDISPFVVKVLGLKIDGMEGKVPAGL